MDNKLMRARVKEINKLHKEVDTRFRTAADEIKDRVFRIGELLIECKRAVRLLKDENWMRWVECECDFSLRSAENYMNAFKRKDDPKSQPVANLAKLYYPQLEHKPKKKQEVTSVAEPQEEPEVEVEAPSPGEEPEKDEEDGLFGAGEESTFSKLEARQKVIFEEDKVRRIAAKKALLAAAPPVAVEELEAEVTPSTPSAMTTERETYLAHHPEITETEFDAVEDDPQDESLKLMKVMFESVDSNRQLKAIKAFFTALDRDTKNLFHEWYIELLENAQPEQQEEAS
jgi:hypothetical protein